MNVMKKRRLWMAVGFAVTVLLVAAILTTVMFVLTNHMLGSLESQRNILANTLSGFGQQVLVGCAAALVSWFAVNRTKDKGAVGVWVAAAAGPAVMGLLGLPLLLLFQWTAGILIAGGFLLGTAGFATSTLLAQAATGGTPSSAAN